MNEIDSKQILYKIEEQNQILRSILLEVQKTQSKFEEIQSSLDNLHISTEM